MERLFVGCCESHASYLRQVAEVWDHEVGNGSWNLTFTRAFNDWELEMVMNLLSTLQEERVSAELDGVSWIGPAGVGFVREAFKVLQPRTDCLFLVKGVWVPSAPTKSVFFAWKAAWSKVLTLDKLQKKGWQLPNRCYLCGCA